MNIASTIHSDSFSFFRSFQIWQQLYVKTLWSVRCQDLNAELSIPCLRLLSHLSNQCDQVARLFFQYLAAYNNENLPKSIHIDTKWVHNFAKYQINLKYCQI